MPDLDELLAAAATDPARRPEFTTALLEAQVLVAGEIRVHDLDGENALTEATLPPLTRADGTHVQPFFTTLERMEETLQAVPGFETRYVTLRCRDFWEMTRGATLVLNPHSAYGKEFHPSEIAQLLDGAAAMTSQVITQPTRVRVGRPAQTPLGMEQALRDLFNRHETVESGYLGWKVVPDTNDQSYLLIIVGEPSTRAELLDELARALLHFSQAHPVDVMFASPGSNHALSTIEPFYARPTRRRWFSRG